MPKIIDVCIVSARSVAQTRDNHYHNPPDYIVLEPEDTSTRTKNLQQTNTNGYKWQGSPSQLLEAKALVAVWDDNGKIYQPIPEYQERLKQLIRRYPYRLDTNFAKMDRISHSGIEEFKRRVTETPIEGKTIGEWSKIFYGKSEEKIRNALTTYLSI